MVVSSRRGRRSGLGVLMAIVALVCSGCVTELQPVGVRAAGADGVEVFYFSCDGASHRLALYESELTPPSPGTLDPYGSEPPEPPEVQVWQGDTPTDRESFVVPLRLRPDRDYTLRDAGPHGALQNGFGPADLPRENVRYLSFSDGDVTTGVDQWRGRARSWCDGNILIAPVYRVQRLGRWLFSPVPLIGVGAVIAMALVALRAAQRRSRR